MSSQSLITVTINKTSSQSSGLFLYKDESNRIIVNSIFSGVFENTQLKPLMEIVSVNGISCEGMTDDFVLSLINNTDGEVTLVAREVIYNAAVVTEQHDDDCPSPSAPIMEPVVASSVVASSSINNPPPTVSSNFQMNYHPTNLNHTAATDMHPNSTSHHQTPPGCLSGGQWLTVRYSGKNTTILCLILCFLFGAFSCCGACAFLCPQDVMDVYVVQNKVYDRNGKYLGSEELFQFE